MNGGSLDTNEVAAVRIVTLRLVVGFLGERDAGGWWPSGFMSSTSAAFLMPVFGPKTQQARYQGVLEAARRVHDERIGVGRAFHPFRLPEIMEQRLFEAVQFDDQTLGDTTLSSDFAFTALEGLASHAVEAKSGPTLVGTVGSLENSGWIAEAASMYAAAFGAGVQCFPYFTGAR